MLLPFDEGAWWAASEVQMIIGQPPRTIGENASVLISFRGGAQVILPVEGGHSDAVRQAGRLVELVNKAKDRD